DRGLQILRRRVLLLQRLTERLERQLVAVQVLRKLARHQAQDARRAVEFAPAHAPDSTRSSIGMWHFLYFFPLPHGHGSLRPTRGPDRTGTTRAGSASRSAAAPSPAPAAGCERPAQALPASACCATIWRGRGRRPICCTASGAACTPNRRWANP